MSKRPEILSSAHARALIKEAIGKIEGDHAIETDGAAEIAAIEAAHASKEPKQTHPPRTKRGWNEPTQA